jgi:hypothetical protein
MKGVIYATAGLAAGDECAGRYGWPALEVSMSSILATIDMVEARACCRLITWSTECLFWPRQQRTSRCGWGFERVAGGNTLGSAPTMLFWG